MNYIKHLTGFFEKVTLDRNLNPTHISLYIALFQFWNCNRFKNPISISRDEVMRISKISSKATYHKCLKALHAQGYIKYEPSYNPFRGSHVFLFNFSGDLKPPTKSERTSSIFEPVAKQVVGKSKAATDTSAEQAHEQAVVSPTNNINIANNPNISKGLNEHPPNKNSDDQNSGTMNFDTVDEEKKLREKKKDKLPTLASEVKDDPVPPPVEEVISYFAHQNIPESEASKFYNYNSSINWLIAGKSPITDWKSAANNWILKIPNYTHKERTDRATSINNTATKDYAEPL